MLRRLWAFGAFSALLVIPSRGQDADFGISVPMTLSGGAMYTERLQLADPTHSPAGGGFRAVLYPTLRLGQHWFGYAAVQIRSTPSLYYDAFDPDHDVYTDTLQAFIGYSFRKGNTAMVIKAGKLASAFGSFPLHYDDAENPLLDQPLSYITDLPLRTNQILSGANALLGQPYGSGGVPVTLYGLPAVQAEVSTGRVDARLQLTSGSPASPQSVRVAGQYLQWAAGGGYTIRQGFRVGVSGFRGPYLDREVAGLLPAGTTRRDFPASGIGTDVQWGRGRWSAGGELQRFRFDSPNFVVSPSVTSGYVEGKAVVTPRLYLAGRAGFLYAGHVVDKSGVAADEFARYLKSYELAAGCWITHNQLLKGSYEWLRSEGGSGTRTDVAGFQYVVQVHSLAWAFR